MIKSATDALAVIWFLFAIVVIATLMQGCGAVGVRHFEVWDGGPSWDFAEGIDFHIGTNQIDNVKDQRGVTPRSAGTNLKEVKY